MQARLPNMLRCMVSGFPHQSFWPLQVLNATQYPCSVQLAVAGGERGTAGGSAHQCGGRQRARRPVGGAHSRRGRPRGEAIDLLAEFEARLDFDENLPMLDVAHMQARIADLARQVSPPSFSY